MKACGTQRTENGMNVSERDQIELEAAAFRRLLKHLDEHKEVQNIDLMNLAGFCRNCLAKWYAAEADARGLQVDYEQARERVYGMPYPQWKEKYQTPSTRPPEGGFSWLTLPGAGAPGSVGIHVEQFGAHQVPVLVRRDGVQPLEQR